jgi:Protein of unknown function (DUF3307)
MNSIAFLCSLFLAHYFANYTHLSTPYMLNAKKIGTPLLPIFLHAAVHAVLMALITACFGFSFSIVCKVFLIELITHFIIDVLKGKMNVWFPKLQNPTYKGHWYIFGADQLAHSLVLIYIYSYTYILNI